MKEQFELSDSCNEKVFEIENAIAIRHIDWNVTPVAIPEDLDFFESAENQVLGQLNVDNLTIKCGKFKPSYFDLQGNIEECELKHQVVWFRVGKSKGNLLLGNDNLAARPCPPFCDEGGKVFSI